MRTYKGISIGVLLAIGAAFFSAPLWQSGVGQATQRATVDSMVSEGNYPSATQAYRDGAAALEAGRSKEALPKLRFAAEQGVLGAQLALARHYADSDRAESFRFFSLVADQHADLTPTSPVAHFVAEAFVALGDARRTGIPGHVEPDADRAAGLYFHAASYFGSAEAQYKLALMHMEGVATPANTDIAVKWLANAAKKRHAMSQALLGEILWRGDAVEAQPVRGLALMMSASESAGVMPSEDADQIERVLARALKEADAETKRAAHAIVRAWREQPRLDIAIDLPEDDFAGRDPTPQGAAEVVYPASAAPAENALTP